MKDAETGRCLQRARSLPALLAAAALIAACSGGGGGGSAGGGDDTTPTFTISGTVSGLAGTGLVLGNNGGGNLAVTANGSFTFAASFATGATYSVTVLTQPSNPSQTCTVTNGSDTGGSANVTNVSVSCVTNTFTVGGTVSGLSGTGLVLRNNGTDNLGINANGGFTFGTAIASGAPYNVTVLAQPSGPGQICTVGNGSGAVGGANVTDVSVACVTITSQGTDFYLTFPDNLCVSSPVTCNDPDTGESDPVTIKLIAAAVTATSVDVTFNGATTTFSVPAGGQTAIPLDPGVVVLTANDAVEAKGIHVRALAPISLHAISESRGSADGYLALPTSSLGTQYLIMSRADPALPGSEFAIVATQNDTMVTIVPKADGETRPANVPFDVLLNAGDTYQLKNPALGDMAGSTVTATKPIAVFGGHLCALIPSPLRACDYLVEQIPDLTRLGKRFRTVLFSGRTRYSVRIIGTVDNTAITCNPAVCPATVSSGQIVDLVLTGSQEIVSAQPLLVAQFMHGAEDEVPGLRKGDPSMVMVTPEEQALTEMTFAVHGLVNTIGAFINVVTPTAALGSLTLDGVAVDPGLFSAFGALGFSGGTIPAAPGAHALRGTAPFTALVYDLGDPLQAVSYAYPAATGLSVIAP